MLYCKMTCSFLVTKSRTCTLVYISMSSDFPFYHSCHLNASLIDLYNGSPVNWVQCTLLSVLKSVPKNVPRHRMLHSYGLVSAKAEYDADAPQFKACKWITHSLVKHWRHKSAAQTLMYLSSFPLCSATFRISVFLSFNAGQLEWWLKVCSWQLCRSQVGLFRRKPIVLRCLCTQNNSYMLQRDHWEFITKWHDNASGTSQTGHFLTYHCIAPCGINAHLVGPQAFCTSTFAVTLLYKLHL